MSTKDFEMDKLEANFRKTINKNTAARRRMAELEKQKCIVIEYIKQWQRELMREKAWDRLYMAFALVMLVLGLYCSYKIGIIPLSISVPAEVVCVSFAFGCVVDAVRLFRGGKRK
jgi:hypothetical protein